MHLRPAIVASEGELTSSIRTPNGSTPVAATISARVSSTFENFEKRSLISSKSVFLNFNYTEMNILFIIGFRNWHLPSGREDFPSSKVTILFTFLKFKIDAYPTNLLRKLQQYWFRQNHVFTDTRSMRRRLLVWSLQLGNQSRQISNRKNIAEFI